MSLPNLVNQTINTTYTGLLQINTPTNTAIPATGVVPVYDGQGDQSSLSIGQVNQGASFSGTLTATTLQATNGAIIAAGTTITGGLTAGDTSVIVLGSANTPGNVISLAGDNTSVIIGTLSANCIVFKTNGTNQLSINNIGWLNCNSNPIINSPSTPKAWVNFSGGSGGTSTAINSQFNVSSVVRNGLGDYTINFTRSIGSTNYCVTGSSSAGATNVYAQNPQMVSEWTNTGTYGLKTATAVRIVCAANNADTAEDCFTGNVVIYGT